MVARCKYYIVFNFGDITGFLMKLYKPVAVSRVTLHTLTYTRPRPRSNTACREVDGQRGCGEVDGLKHTTSIFFIMSFKISSDCYYIDLLYVPASAMPSQPGLRFSGALHRAQSRLHMQRGNGGVWLLRASL